MLKEADPRITVSSFPVQVLYIYSGTDKNMGMELTGTDWIHLGRDGVVNFAVFAEIWLSGDRVKGDKAFPGDNHRIKRARGGGEDRFGAVKEREVIDYRTITFRNHLWDSTVFRAIKTAAEYQPIRTTLTKVMQFFEW